MLCTYTPQTNKKQSTTTTTISILIVGAKTCWLIIIVIFSSSRHQEVCIPAHNYHNSQTTHYAPQKTSCSIFVVTLILVKVC